MIMNSRNAAFTLIEMLVVVGMLGILMAATFGGVGQARNRARVAKATAEVRELTNAILSYEAAEGDLEMIAQSPKDATEGNLKDLLGASGKPVYLNAPIVNGAFRDPWGTPYRYRVIKEAVASSVDLSESFAATVTFPNRDRRLR